ncbi:hypothetical protein HQ393_08755 [Chitinibacter bivalviorum]|uniref:Uncharacterized protein n=1 Tax=Chitinibacter bivalviorum TaxID=2739434 RepID=A0A7H9BHY3_9NEIS|nr:hypothetical protein [Chitinibacter bivalviorum]QLG88330.1 hypothetical protein HQ393_08755 [Chitinibacter bivalviorum]
MKIVDIKQPLTATRTATETATVVHVFQRAGSKNYYVRYKPSEAALPAFDNRKDIWESTGTSDKREAENRGVGLLAAMIAKEKQYLDEFLPYVQKRFIECKTEAERTDIALKMAGGWLYKDFLRQQELLELQLKVAGLWLLRRTEY